MAQTIEIGEEIGIFVTQKKKTVIINIKIIKIEWRKDVISAHSSQFALCLLPNGDREWFTVSYLKMLKTFAEKLRSIYRSRDKG
jgi:hypothetical protein